MCEWKEFLFLLFTFIVSRKVGGESFFFVIRKVIDLSVIFTVNIE